MALGIPCISTDCRPGGARYIIDNGKDGFIVPLGDKESLANTIKAILESKTLQKQFSKKARIKTSQFAPTSIYTNWENYFYRVKRN